MIDAYKLYFISYKRTGKNFTYQMKFLDEF